MRLFLKNAAGRKHTAEQAVSRLTEQRQQTLQQRKEEREKLKAEKERKQEAERQAAREKQQEAERQAAERQAAKEKQQQAELQEREQAAREKQQEAELQAEKWKAVAADYKESLEQYTQGYKQILEQLEALQTQQEVIPVLKEKQEYILKNFPTLEANIVDKLKGTQTSGTQEIVRYLEEMARTQKRRNLWTKILLVISLLCNGAMLGGMVVLLLYFADRIVL